MGRPIMTCWKPTRPSCRPLGSLWRSWASSPWRVVWLDTPWARALQAWCLPPHERPPGWAQRHKYSPHPHRLSLTAVLMWLFFLSHSLFIVTFDRNTTEDQQQLCLQRWTCLFPLHCKHFQINIFLKVSQLLYVYILTHGERTTIYMFLCRDEIHVCLFSHLTKSEGQAKTCNIDTRVDQHIIRTIKSQLKQDFLSLTANKVILLRSLL